VATKPSPTETLTAAGPRRKGRKRHTKYFAVYDKTVAAAMQAERERRLQQTPANQRYKLGYSIMAELSDEEIKARQQRLQHYIQTGMARAAAYVAKSLFGES
jgi:hypothetical protein